MVRTYVEKVMMPCISFLNWEMVVIWAIFVMFQHNMLKLS
jgi:hypothetical protein